MAYICTKPKGSCPTCNHFRPDEDYGTKVCWAEYDEKQALKSQSTQPNRKDNKPCTDT